MTQPQRPAQPIDPAIRADDESSVVSAQQATPAWRSTGDVATYAAPARSALLAVQVGTLVAERYEVVQALGEGGMGLVFRAKDRKLRRDLVLKFIRPDLVHQPGMVERLCAEAEAAAALNHPHVVTLHNRESDPHGEFLIMEFVDGPNLLQLLKDAGGKLSVERAVRYIGQVGSALQAAHDAGILHRDVKPSNVLINKSDIAKLADFGLARIVEDSGQTKSGAVLGTLDYMAPEQLRDARLASPHSDQFSLAAMLYQLVTGNSPLRIRERDIPAELRDVLLRAVEDQPQKRFPSVAEFIQALPRSSVVEASRLSPDARHVGHNEPADLAKEFARLHAAAQKQSIEARQAFEQHDFERAAKIGGQIPEELRDGQLLRDAITKRDRVAELDHQIREAVQAAKLSGLQLSVEELLQLQPLRADMTRLLEQIKRLVPARTIQREFLVPELPNGVTKMVISAIHVQEGDIVSKGKMVAEVDVETEKMAVEIEIPFSGRIKKVHANPGDSIEVGASFLTVQTDDFVGDDLAPRVLDSAAIPNQIQCGTKAGERMAFTLNGIEYAFRWCPAGKFLMGSSVSVELTSGFWMQETTVTQSMWQAVMGTQPWQGMDHVKEGAKYPATYVDWSGATEFAAKLTAAARKSGVLPASSQLTLPTEARWEYACCAGTTTNYSFGKDAGKLGEYAWFTENAWDIGEKYAHEVGQKRPNPWGLLDMHGNVWEWCQDYYAAKWEAVRDPLGPATASYRMGRGGGCADGASALASAVRRNGSPDSRGSSLGFRLALGHELK